MGPFDRRHQPDVPLELLAVSCKSWANDEHTISDAESSVAMHCYSRGMSKMHYRAFKAHYMAVWKCEDDNAFYEEYFDLLCAHQNLGMAFGIELGMEHLATDAQRIKRIEADISLAAIFDTRSFAWLERKFQKLFMEALKPKTVQPTMTDVEAAIVAVENKAKAEATHPWQFLSDEVLEGLFFSGGSDGLSRRVKQRRFLRAYIELNERQLALDCKTEVARMMSASTDEPKKPKTKKKKNEPPPRASAAVRRCAQGAVDAVLAAARAADAARSAAELARRHADHAARLRAEEMAAQAARSGRARRAREARARDGGQPFTITQRQLGKDRAVGRDRTAEEERQHRFHVDPAEKAARALAFDDKQAAAHRGKVERLRKSAHDGRRSLEKSMSAAHEAATHVVPPRPTLAVVFE